MAKKIGQRTVTVIRAQKVDRLSPASSTPPPEHEITGCAIMPRTSFEQDKGWVIVEGRMVVAPFESDVLSTDQVRIDDEVWDVDGEPGDYENRRSKGKATIFYLKRLGTD